MIRPGEVKQLLLITLLIIGCDQKTKVDFQNENVMATITLLTFQGNQESAWPKDSSGYIYTTARTITFTGTCARNTKSLMIKVDGATAPSLPTCDKTTGDFTWSHTFGSDLTAVVDFIPILLADNQESQANKITKTIVVDTVAPADPVITTNGGGNINSPSANVTINGTTSADTYRVTSTDSGTLVFTSAAQTFQLDTVLVENQTKTISFTALDLAGNASGSVSIQATFLGSTLLKIADFTAGSLASPQTNGSVRLTHVSSSPLLPATPVINSSPGNYKHFLGVTNVSSQ